MDPPPINSNVRIGHKFRFVASAAIVDVSIQSDDLLAVCGNIAYTTTNLTGIARSAKLKSVEVWTPTATSTTPTTCSVEWPASQRSPSMEVSDTSINISRPAHIKASPPKESLSAFWFDESTNAALFILNAPIGSVVDVQLEYFLLDSGTGIATTVTGATIGQLYYGYLDGDTTHLLAPVSLKAIF
jgi:hypothetical protein